VSVRRSLIGPAFRLQSGRFLQIGPYFWCGHGVMRVIIYGPRAPISPWIAEFHAKLRAEIDFC
jgi:hypothetical protein